MKITSGIVILAFGSAMLCGWGCHGASGPATSLPAATQAATTPTTAASQPSVMEIKADTVLPKGAVLQTPLVIKASNITLDGNGATILGPGTVGKSDSFEGTGISAEKCSNVTIRNLKVRGFKIALAVKDAEKWTIEHNDFSDNFTDPDVRWHDLGHFGGVILTHVHKSVIRGNTIQRVWNAIDLTDSDDNTIVGNTASHCHNMCLKLWNSSRNVIEKNDLSYGLRKKEADVHAFDSAGVMIECGSNNNRFVGNDVTHGGDGIFLRCTNDRVSEGNVFIENDCSWANNNCIESVCPRNVFLRNKANHGSYGMWMYWSDGSVIEGNEIAFNGLPGGNHNAPELEFGSAGITFVYGTSNHTVIRGNYIHDNSGPAIALRGDERSMGKNYRAYHWIIQQNRMESNGMAIFAKWGDMLCLAANTCKDNKAKDHIESVSRMTVVDSVPADARAPKATLEGPSKAMVGQAVEFDASGSTDPVGRALSCQWDLGGQEAKGAKVRRVFDKPGFYRISLTVSNGQLADLAWRDLYVTGAAPEIGTEDAGDVKYWTFDGDRGGQGKFSYVDGAVKGKRALMVRVEPYAGGDAEISLNHPGWGTWKPGDTGRLTFWLRYCVDGDRGFRAPNPVVRLYGADGQIVYVPSTNYLGSWSGTSEARWGWRPVVVDLAGSDAWKKVVKGKPSLQSIRRVGLTFMYDPWDTSPFTIWIDGLSIE